MTLYSDLRTAIKTTLDTVTDVGVTHNRQRLHLGGDWSRFLTLFKTTIGGHDQLRGWMILRESAVPTDSDFGETARLQNFLLVGIMGFQDSGDSYGTFQALCDTVMATFEDETTMGVSGVIVGGIGPCTLREFGEEMLGSVLCHVGFIELPILTMRAQGTP